MYPEARRQRKLGYKLINFGLEITFLALKLLLFMFDFSPSFCEKIK